ncbi:MAG TPA: 4-hydroxyphenylpyruvate dioxygenase [Trichocoleus sp.]
MSNFCTIQQFDHIEFYVGNAKQSAFYYAQCFGFTNTAYKGLETGSRETVSYVMEQGAIRFVLSAALNSDHPIAARVFQHGDHAAVIALQVLDTEKAYWQATSRGAIGAIPPTEEADEQGVLRYAAIRVYGDTFIKFVDRTDYKGQFAPSYQPRHSIPHPHPAGLLTLDHVVANVEVGAMDRWVQFFTATLGFDLLIHFDDQTIVTEYSALMSKVVQDSTGRIKLPINEPSIGKHKSQIEEYLDYHQGAGIQHIALSTNNIIAAVTKLKTSGVEFLHTPKSYYAHLKERVGNISEPIDQLAELGILVDRDQEGYLLQIFTKPIQDRPTLFFEVIERHGSQGFGEGNFKALFEAIEREQALRGNL